MDPMQMERGGADHKDGLLAAHGATVSKSGFCIPVVLLFGSFAT